MGEDSIFFYRHQGPFHGKEGPRKITIMLGQVVKNLEHLTVYG